MAYKRIHEKGAFYGIENQSRTERGARRLAYADIGQAGAGDLKQSAGGQEKACGKGRRKGDPANPAPLQKSSSSTMETEGNPQDAGDWACTFDIW